MTESLVDHYMKQDAIIQDHIAGAQKSTCVKVRWDDVTIEAVDISDTYVLCTGRVITKESVEATLPNGYGYERFYLIWKGRFFRIVQSRILPDIEGTGVYTELLVAPVSGAVAGTY